MREEFGQKPLKESENAAFAEGAAGIEIQSLGKTYGGGQNEVKALRGVSFSLKAGDLAVVLGPSGSGKSTLLNCIVGELSLFDGEIIRRNGLTVGYLRQNCDFSSANTLFD